MTDAQAEAGFTMVEMLVGLMVLSVSALALSATLSGGIRSYQAVSGLSSDIKDRHNLQTALDSIGRGYFLESQGQSSEGAVFVFQTGEKLSVQPDGEAYNLIWSGLDGDEVLFKGEQNLRIRVGVPQSVVAYTERRVSSSSKFLIVERNTEADWVELASAPLRVTVRFDCRYDIVGRRCR